MPRIPEDGKHHERLWLTPLSISDHLALQTATSLQFLVTLVVGTQADSFQTQKVDFDITSIDLRQIKTDVS